KCLDQCNKVISSGKYGLYQDYAEAFRIPNENGKETLFGIGFGTANNSISFWEAGQFNVRLLPRELKGQISGVNAQGWQVATQALYDSYHPQDRRREVTLLTRINNQDGTTTTVEPHFQKYWDKVNEPLAGNTEHDFPYLRYADILLMKAEALNELNNGPTGEAYDAVNQVRRRARFNGTINALGIRAYDTDQLEFGPTFESGSQTEVFNSPAPFVLSGAPPVSGVSWPSTAQRIYNNTSPNGTKAGKVTITVRAGIATGTNHTFMWYQPSSSGYGEVATPATAIALPYWIAPVDSSGIMGTWYGYNGFAATGWSTSVGTFPASIAD
ncbi:MAG: RagB/SusD family nutrient uptake outer membrane protein, partial [Proteobacteria bacterium]|nr:RagB/SusD family nutrient uptake outer membrane protein [Pseudomonadota bacterium]